MTRTIPARGQAALSQTAEPAGAIAASVEEPVGRPARSRPDLGQTWTYTDEPVFKLSVDAYHELIRLGHLTSDDKVELIEGVLVHRVSKNPRHEFSKGKLNAVINRLLPSGWHSRTEAPVTLPDSEPEPDVSVVRGMPRDYLENHPQAVSIGLVVEVAHTTLRRDRGSKHRVYARGGVGVYWIVNLTAREIEVYTDPRPDADPPTYAEPRRYGENDTVDVVLDGMTVGRVNVRDVLP